MPAHVPADREADLDAVEVGEQRVKRRRGEELQMRRIRLGMPACDEADAALQAEGVRHRADEASARLQDAKRMSDRCGRIGEVLQKLTGDDDVERLVLERQPFLHVRPRR